MSNLKRLQLRSSVGAQAEETEGEPLSPAARLFHEPDFNVYIMAEMGCKTEINVEVVKENLVHTLLKHPRFSSLQVKDEGGTMRWVPTRVDLRNHVIVPDISPFTSTGEEYIEDYISDLTTAPIDTRQPMWDFHILNVRTSKAAAVGVFRIHHSLGDGMSLISLLLACMRRADDPAALPTIPRNKEPEPPVKGFWWSARLAWNTMIDVLMFFATTLFLKDTETPIKGKPRLGSGRWRFVHRTVSLDDIKFVKNALNATINDVMMGVTLAALSRYLNNKYGESDDVKQNLSKKNNIPRNIRLRGALLVNTRTSTGIHELADMMERGTKAKWGNHVGVVLIPFPITIHDDPLEYIHVAKKVIDRKKQSLEAFASCIIVDLVFKIFGVKAAVFIAHRAPQLTTMSFSNVVGPSEEICFYGHPMAYLAPGCYGQPNALMINCQSYANKMTFVLSVDENTISDPHRLCDDIEQSFKLIKDAIPGRYLGL